MLKLESKLLSMDLMKEIQELEFKIDGTGTKMAFPQSYGLPFDKPKLMEAVNEIESIRGLIALYLMVNWMEPGIIADWHQDWLKPSPLQGKNPCLERWHLPVITNIGSLYFDKIGEVINMKQGIWYGPVKYWEKHKVVNWGIMGRIHIVVDLDCHKRLGEYE